MNQDNLSAQVFLTVNTLEDQNDGSEVDGLSLRDAIIQANSDTRRKYIINVPNGTYNLTLTQDGSLDITSNISIIGAIAGSTIISPDNLLGDRIFTVSGTGNLILDNLTLKTNVPEGQDQTSIDIDGGAISIETSGKAVLVNTIIEGHRTSAKGGAIANKGILEVNDSFIKNNFSDGSGGGIYNTGTITILRSTISTNSTGNTIEENADVGGGGIFNDVDGNLTIINSTISNNQSLTGGGIWTLGNETTIINSTIVENVGTVGRGIYSGETTSNTLVFNSIIANNKIPDNSSGPQIPIIKEFPQFNLSDSSGPVKADFIEQFMLDTTQYRDRNLIDSTTVFETPYDVRILLRNTDPFSELEIDITSQLGLRNLIFNQDADIEYVFNRFSTTQGSDDDNFFSENNGFSSSENNLVQNIDQDFGFAYFKDPDNTEPDPTNPDDLVFLNTDFDFDSDGKLILALSFPDLNPNTNFSQDIFIADRGGIFEFDRLNNTLQIDNSNKRQASYVRNPENDKVFNYSDIVTTESIQVGTQPVETPEPLDPTKIADIDGYFNDRSFFNIIGSSKANGILDGFNNNTVGTLTNPFDPKIGPLQNNGGFTPTHAPLRGSLAINNGNNAATQIRDIFNYYGQTDQIGNPRINDNKVDIGSVEFDINQSEFANDGDALLNSPVFRFQNKNVPGTYLYAGSQEAQSIRSNFPNFSEEGVAFKVSQVPDDELIPIYRFQNTLKRGTYLYAGEQERQSILTNNRNFTDEGIAFYVYGADADKGQDIYRFQNTNNLGTYLFVGEAEKNNILANFNNFQLEGVAFEVGI